MRRLLFYTVNKLYDIEISDSTLSRITDKILPIVKECPAAAREYVKERGVQVIQKEEKTWNEDDLRKIPGLHPVFLYSVYSKTVGNQYHGKRENVWMGERFRNICTQLLFCCTSDSMVK